MTYTQLALVGVALIVIDLFVLRTRLLPRRVFWVAYAIIVFFQLVTNGVLTGFSIVRYDGDEIIGTEDGCSSVTVGWPSPRSRTCCSASRSSC